MSCFILMPQPPNLILLHMPSEWWKRTGLRDPHTHSPSIPPTTHWPIHPLTHPRIDPSVHRSMHRSIRAMLIHSLQTCIKYKWCVKYYARSILCKHKNKCQSLFTKRILKECSKKKVRGDWDRMAVVRKGRVGRCDLHLRWWHINEYI